MKTNIDNGRLWGLLWLSLFMYAAITTAGLKFVVTDRVGRFMMFALAIMVPWADLPWVAYHLTTVTYTAITFGPPRGATRIGAYIEWSAQLGSLFQFRIGGSPDGDWDLGINLFAMLLLLFAWTYNRLPPALPSGATTPP